MPIQGDKIIPLTADSVLERTSEYDIYRYYLGGDFALGRAICSPFREDKRPSFSVEINKKGNLKHFDYGHNEYSGGCIDFVMQLFNTSYNQALRKIDSDLNLGISSGLGKVLPDRIERVGPKVRTPSFFQVTVKAFTQGDLDYWRNYGITEQELKDNQVYSVKKLVIDKKVYPLGKVSPTFGYYYGGKWKIYRPLSTTDKWLSNVPGDRMSGLERVRKGCDTVIVTKSKKDEILLSKLLPFVCSVQAENNISINSTNISFLNSTCNRVLLNFDSDKVGVRASKHYNQFGFGWINCPVGYTDPSGRMIKDFSDMARYYGLEEVRKYFKSKGII